MRVSSREKHNQHLQHQGQVSIIDGYNRDNIDAVDRLDLGLGSLAVDPDGPVAADDPDVWPPPTPDPSRGGAVLHQGATCLRYFLARISLVQSPTELLADCCHTLSCMFSARRAIILSESTPPFLNQGLRVKSVRTARCYVQATA